MNSELHTSLDDQTHGTLCLRVMLSQANHSGADLSSPSPTRSELTHRIKEKARLLGFDKIGIVRAEALKEEQNRLREWLGRGYHGAMQWMARDPEKRTDPRKLLPSARSIIVVALNYYTPEHHSSEFGTGKVSRYAWGDDYHDVVGSKLRLLLSWIVEQVPDSEGKVCVDIQPMMDKSWARKAGLGWIGKHTNLITQDLGSWVFIGELLVNLELDYETEQSEDHCGSCTLCIEACPTQAITEPYVLDSNKCISYLTIELREPEMPKEFGTNLQGWLYGCDICQDVCPWNRFEQITAERGFRPRPGNVNTELQQILSLTQEDYAEHYRGSSMKRAKLSGMQRNARQLVKNEESI